MKQLISGGGGGGVENKPQNTSLETLLSKAKKPFSFQKDLSEEC